MKPIQLVAPAAAIWALAGCGTSADSGGPADARAPAAATASAPSSLEPLDRLSWLEKRATLLHDTNEIKRLQRAFGYYFDAGQWDAATELFSEGGSIEFALDGVYVGRPRIREYLYAFGGGMHGLAEGVLREQLQLMPVVTVAPDGRTAKARWRGILLAGRLGENAYWGEGTFENDYVKEEGVWKIGKLHWYQSFYVPYADGWLDTEDANNGKWISDVLPPDEPSTIEYSVWPDVYVPPFHFDNPGNARAHDRRAEAVLAAVAAEPQDRRSRAERAAGLERVVQQLEDERAIEKLQRIYGFYIDKQLWTQAAALFSDDATLEVGNSGVYVGKGRVLAYLHSLGPEYPQEGRLYDRMQLQPIVHVAPDGHTAKGRWHLFAQEAMYGEYANWGLGVYENDYVKVDGEWKIKNLHLYVRMYTPYSDGWGKTALPLGKPSETVPPDRPPSGAYEAYPATFFAPFHYDRPMMRDPIGADGTAASGESSAGRPGSDEQIAAVERRIGLLEDADQIERLNAVYGYYLAHSQSDNMAAIFAEDGTIEIALRGVYVGRASVRRNLDLYTEPGIQYGLLHNHMQYQPVIDVAPDGKTALVRSRAFSIMGQFERYAQWMGGIYENEYKRDADGVWRIAKDHVFNTYFVPYQTGWKDAPLRSPPGVTESNPPDLPPSATFEMYPNAYLPKFHYNPSVTMPADSDR